MTTHSTDTDFVKRIILTPEVTRVFWSTPRAWRGDVVHIHIETRNVPDGTKVTFDIWEDDSAEGSADDFIVQLDGEFVIENNRCIVDYELAWEDEQLDQPLEVEGDAYEFYCRAFVENYELEGRSNIMYVAIDQFKLSG